MRRKIHMTVACQCKSIIGWCESIHTECFTDSSIIEGLYCFLNVAPWNQVGALLDERIWVDVDR